MSALITAEGLVRLDAALAWIDQHPEQHYQGAWMRHDPECGTTYCLAGAIAHLAGAEPIWREDDGEVGSLDAYQVRTSSGEEQDVDQFAADLLGLDRDGDIVDFLFYGAQDRDDLGEIRDDLADSLTGAI